ncbi:hypothetical protein LCGC14_3123660, partial [marine sediment metagenome]
FFSNPAVKNISGYCSEEAAGRNIKEFIHPDDRTGFTEYIQNMVHGDGSTYSAEIDREHRCRFIKKNGEIKWLDVKCRPMRNLEGKITAVSGVARDITQEVEIKRQLVRAQRMEAIGTLAGGIAHDFNNILTPIIGYTEMNIEDAGEDSPLRTALTETFSAANRAKELVRHILTFSRESEHERKPLKVQLIVREVLKLLRASLPVTVVIKESIECKDGAVMADPTEIHQIIMNLCTNSYHAMGDKGGVLEVRVSEVYLDSEAFVQVQHLKPGSYLRLAVSDTGCGMEQVVIERIFEPYFTTKGRGEGTGLGLSTVHGIVSSLGGGMSVYSEPGKGTTFHVY